MWCAAGTQKQTDPGTPLVASGEMSAESPVSKDIAGRLWIMSNDD